MKEIDQAARRIQAADAILISASNGLSISEGFNIFANNDDFHRDFREFESQYGVTNILQGALGNLPADAHAAFIRQLRKYMLDDYQGSQVFSDLKALVGQWDYFVVTSNADKHFQQNGFATDKIWEIEGNFFD